jgi:drug/metabolite transporter (DMT)-like permease
VPRSHDSAAQGHAADDSRPAAGPHRVPGQVLAAGAAVLFGSGYVATAFALRSFTPLGIALWRGVIATLVLLPFALGQSRAHPFILSPARTSRLLVLGISAGLAFVVAMNVAVALSGATLAAFAASLGPIVAILLAPILLQESLGGRAVLGFLAAVVGTALLSKVAMSGSATIGVVAGLGASLCFGAFLVLSRRWSGRYRLTDVEIALAIAGSTAIGLLPVELVGEPASLLPATVRPDELLGLAWLALVPGVAAQILVIASTRRVETRSSAAVLLISPITTAVLAAALLGESLDLGQAMGAALILAGVGVAAGLEFSSAARTVRRLFKRAGV